MNSLRQPMEDGMSDIKTDLFTYVTSFFENTHFYQECGQLKVFGSSLFILLCMLYLDSVV